MHEQLIIASSDPAVGAQARSQDGSSFDLVFDTPIETGQNTNPTIRLISAEIWYTMHNVTTANNQLVIKYSDNTGDIISVLSIPPGLYGLLEINLALERELEQASITHHIGTNSLVFQADNATGKCVLTLSSENRPVNLGNPITNLNVAFSDSRSTLRNLLGFDAEDVTLTSPNAKDLYEASNVANLAPISSLQLHCSAARGAIVHGSSASSCIASIALDASPGHQILHRPFHTPRIRANLLRNKCSRIRFTLTDQNGVPVDTNSEYYTCTLLLEW